MFSCHIYDILAYCMGSSKRFQSSNLPSYTAGSFVYNPIQFQRSYALKMRLPVNLLVFIFFCLRLSVTLPTADESSNGGSRSPSPDTSGGSPSQTGNPVDPASIPLPPQRGNHNAPPAGHRGVWTTDDSVTHVQYGDDPVHGIPKHP